MTGTIRSNPVAERHLAHGTGPAYRRLVQLLLCTMGLLAAGASCHDVFGPSGPPIYGVIVGIGAPVVKFVLPGMTLNMFVQANDSNHVVIQVDSWKWASSNQSVADVDQQGHVTVKTAGSTVITATVRGRSGSFTLPVETPQSVYAIDPDVSNLLPGQQRFFRIIEGLNSNPVAINARGTWTSSNPNVALVDSNGVVSGVGPGKATLTVVRNVGVDITLKADVTVPSVSSPLRFQQVVAGDVFTCGRTSSETYCWGKNTLGTTAAIDRCSKYTDYSGAGRVYYVRTTFECAMEPVRVDAPVPFASISAQGTIACGVSADGRAYCWGDGTAPSAFPGSSVPTLVSDSLRFANFVGQCGVTTTNEGWCFGPLALRGTAEASGTVSRVAGGAVWRRIDVVGTDYRCGVEVDGTFACWGANAKGQLGTGDLVASSVPVPIKSTERFNAGISGAYQQACALSVAGVVYCWGNGSPTPTPFTAAEPLTSLSGDVWYGFCGLTAGGLTYCGSTVSQKMNPVLPTLRFTSAATNGSFFQHHCALAVDALLYCWGLNDFGELGVGNQDYVQIPTRVVGQ